MEMFLQLKLGPLRSPPELVLDDSDKPFANERQRRNVQKRRRAAALSANVLRDLAVNVGEGKIVLPERRLQRLIPFN